MHLMRIHHYTKALTLPLILKNRTLRFTRADCLDDTAEVPFRNAQLDPGLFFVSSWTLQTTEQSGQWLRYGDDSKGVRISFSASPFLWSKLNINIERIITKTDGSQVAGVGYQVIDVDAPYDLVTALGKGYVLFPGSADLRTDFGGNVTYVDDPIAEAAKFVKVSGDSTTIYGRGSSVARIKRNVWSDQNEYRYVIFAAAGPELNYSMSPSAYREALLDMVQRKVRSPALQFIDMPFGAPALEGLTVMLGTKISDEDKAVVINAVRKYAPSAVLLESTLSLR